MCFYCRFIPYLPIYIEILSKNYRTRFAYLRKQLAHDVKKNQRMSKVHVRLRKFTVWPIGRTYGFFFFFFKKTSQRVQFFTIITHTRSAIPLIEFNTRNNLSRFCTYYNTHIYIDTNMYVYKQRWALTFFKVKVKLKTQFVFNVLTWLVRYFCS